MASVRAVINTDFGEGAPGEIVEVDEDLWADYFEAGFLSLVDERGDRIVPVVAREGFPDPGASE